MDKNNFFRSDRFYMIITIISVIVLFVVVYNNWGAMKTSDSFGNGGYYFLDKVNSVDEKSIWSSMNNGREFDGCAVQSPVNASEKLISVKFSYAPYDVQYFFLSQEYLPSSVTSDSFNLAFTEWTPFNSQVLTANNGGTTFFTGDANGYKLASYFGQTDSKYDEVPYDVEIIAPWGGKFQNANTDAGSDIIITNYAGDQRITFSNVSNWFCSGDMPQGLEEEDTVLVNWKEHQQNHSVPIGNLSNSVCKSFSAGTVIGYLNSNTSICIEVYQNGKWVPITIEQWLKPAQ